MALADSSSPAEKSCLLEISLFLKVPPLARPLWTRVAEKGLPSQEDLAYPPGANQVRVQVISLVSKRQSMPILEGRGQKVSQGRKVSPGLLQCLGDGIPPAGNCQVTVLLLLK